MDLFLRKSMLNIVTMLCILMWGSLSNGFASLQELASYAQSIEESVTPLNRDFLNPDFSHFYRQQQTSWISKIKNFIFPGSENTDLVQQSLSLLKQLVVYRELQGYGYRHVARLSHAPGDKLIIWTDLQGAFHSFVRGLQELHRQEILGDDFVIKKKNYYLILNANAVGVSHVNLELLMVMMLLMIKNPHQVVYILGSHEDRDLWIDQGIVRESASILGLQGISLSPQSSIRTLGEFKLLVTRFYDTLPLALYIDYPTASPPAHNLIRISGLNNSKLDERWYDEFFERQNTYEGTSENILTYRIDNKILSPQRNFVRALITSIGGAVDFEKTEGLLQVDPKNGTTVWSVFSGPTIFNRAINDFFNDAFVTVNLTDQIDTVTIDLFARDIRLENDFRNSTSYALISGIETSGDKDREKKKLKQIIIGASLDLSREQRSIGRLIRDGSVACMVKANRDLALEDAVLHIAFFDDRSSPQQSLQNIKDIYQEYGSSTICFTIGASLAYSYLDKVKRDEMLLLFPVISTVAWHNPSYSGVVFLRPSLLPEIQVLIDYALEKAPERKFCCLYEDDDYGRSALMALKEHLKKYNINDIIEIPHLRSETSFNEQVTLFKKHSCDSLIFCTSAAPAYEFIQQLGVEHLYNVNLYGLSRLGDPHFKRFLKDRGLEMVCTHVVPNPATSTLPLVKEYRERMDYEEKPHDTFSLEGYIATALLVDALKHINLKIPLTHTILQNYFTSLHDYSLGGFSFSFDPQLRNLSKTIWLETTSAAEWKPFVHEPEELP
jgi:ABC-type branched-subunit amino acid transport system substrate-binding protein